jgi:hypothetical protein
LASEQAAVLSHRSIAMLDKLISIGLVESRQGAGGELEVAESARHLSFLPIVALRRPMLESASPSVSTDVMTLSLLDMLGLLHREGFSGTREALDSWTADDEQKSYRLQSVSAGPKIYFACLLRRSVLVGKGLLRMSHYGPASFYRALMCHRKPQEVQVALEDEGRSSMIFEKFLEDAGVPAREARPVEPGDHDLPLVEVGADDVMMGPVQLNQLAVDQAMLQPFVLPDYGGILPEQVSLHFSPPWSHGSGQLRGFVRCPWGHEHCWKYRQLNVAGSRERLIAFLSAWTIMGAGLERGEHVGSVPAESMVDQQEHSIFPAP